MVVRGLAVMGAGELVVTGVTTVAPLLSLLLERLTQEVAVAVRQWPMGQVSVEAILEALALLLFAMRVVK
tara:strand:- start:356 stop:565 length:210 start_codon:yes stop_codon:yes gene_type:complete